MVQVLMFFIWFREIILFLFNQSKQYLLQSQANPLLLAINFVVLFLLKKEAQKEDEEKNH
jgi:hypothetical protein